MGKNKKNKKKNTLNNSNDNINEKIINNFETIHTTNPSANIITNISASVSMSVEDYNIMQNYKNNLIRENTELKKEKEDMRRELWMHLENEKKYIEEIKNNNLTIEQLKKENEELKKEIIDLKKQLLEQNNKIENLQKENKKLSERIDDIVSKSMFDKFMIGIQDINEEESFEFVLGKNIVQKIKRLRENRNSECHYLRYKDTDDIKNDKRYILFERLTNIEPAVKTLFNKKYPNLIDKLLPYIKKDDPKSSQDILDELNEWFEY